MEFVAAVMVGVMPLQRRMDNDGKSLILNMILGTGELKAKCRYSITSVSPSRYCECNICLLIARGKLCAKDQ